MDRDVALANLCQMLEYVKVRPAMYFGREEPEAALTFLDGFSSAWVAALGWSFVRYEEIREEVTKSRGWRWTARRPHHQMIAKGLSASAIIAELIDIEADCIRRMTDSVVEDDSQLIWPTIANPPKKP